MDGETTLERAHEMQEQLITWRREFHMRPELGFQERKHAPPPVSRR
jgi:metal-dependent amidase/aminoacylase/carboxypeptidase family protein